MLLDLEKIETPMKLVYQFSKNQDRHAARIAAAQALSQDPSRPNLGLKASHGLYASDEWWANIERRTLPLLFFSGTIRKAYVAGQDGGNENNSIELALPDGSVIDVGIYVDEKPDIALFRPGHRVELVYALDELKKQPAADGGINYARTALEMAVSLQPADVRSNHADQ